MPVKQVIEQGRVPVKVYTDEIEAGARQQLVNLSRLPIVFHHIAAMADVHTGIGATVGSVIATERAIIPAAVGVDIGCGMIASRTSLTANDMDEKALKRVFDQISRDVPVGRDQHQEGRALKAAARSFEPALKRILGKHPALEKRFPRAQNWVCQLGTLGGGNHFIEVCLDEAGHVWVTRKGAIRARDGDLGIIPGSMGTRSYIVRGKGAEESFDSCAHGAGRRMSRAAATKTFTPQDVAAQTAGVLCRKDKGVIDEIPAAYKDIDEVMANQSDLVDVLHTLKQVICVKG